MLLSRWGLWLLVLAMLLLAPGCSAGGGGDAEEADAPLISVAVAPASLALMFGESHQFTALVQGSANTAVVWSASAGVIANTGLYVAPHQAGSVTVTATSVASATVVGTAIVTISAPPPPITVSVSPTAVSVEAGTMQQFTATVTGTESLSVMWSASGGSISGAGLFTAPQSAGTITVTATSVGNANISGTATVTVTKAPSDYDQAVLADNPFAYWPHNTPNQTGADATGNGHNSVYSLAPAAPSLVVMPNQDPAVIFNGSDQYFEVADHDALSISTTGRLTVEAWICPSALEFPNNEGSGYVHWLGKGSPTQHEYVLRMYSFTNAEDPSRPNRISGYAFNLAGGLGSGSYFQDVVDTTHWVHVTVVYDTLDVSGDYPTGYVLIYKNGVLRDTTALNQYNVVPQNGTAPLRIGTRNLSSFFAGAIGKIALYDYALSAFQIQNHYQQMCWAGC